MASKQISKYISKHIDRLILDPNNYRFIDNKDYIPVSENNLTDSRVQKRTYTLLAGKNETNISDLTISFKSNGVLKLDPIQVKMLDNNNVLVIEGNRRTAALKYLYIEFKKGNDVGKLTIDSFKSIQLISISDENSVQHLITMGLHHISGKKKWTPINQAQLIYDLKNKHNLSEDKICNSLSITKYNLRRSLRVLALIERYKLSDFGDQFQTNMYSIFEEVIKKVELKAWLDWNDKILQADNKTNEEKLFSWISKDEITERHGEENEQIIVKESIITKSREIRELAKFINDKKAITHMEESRSIIAGFVLSDAVGESRLSNALGNLKKEVNTAFQFSEYMNDNDFKQIATLRDKLDILIPYIDSKALINISEKNISKYYKEIQKHFVKVNITNYRRLNNIEMTNFSRVNIFAGNNNTGKTSILEAFYLLTQLNYISAFLELERFRGRFINDFHSKWIVRNFNSDIKINGIFNKTKIFLHILKYDSEENIKKTNYLSSIKSKAIVNKDILSTSLDLYSNSEPELFFQKSKILCNATFSSPYRNNPNLLKHAHARAIKEKYYDEIVKFIIDNMDSSIEKIEMTNVENESRFLVSSSRNKEAIDITKYGEGLQRIFEIALLIGYSRNGIICIDEVDSAIHKSLLIKFTKFIQQAADKFNVQVFLSTHSKECIDAFVKNKYNNQDITAYILTDNQKSISCKYVDGKRLERLIENINLDIR